MRVKKKVFFLFFFLNFFPSKNTETINHGFHKMFSTLIIKKCFLSTKLASLKDHVTGVMTPESFAIPGIN